MPVADEGPVEPVEPPALEVADIVAVAALLELLELLELLLELLPVIIPDIAWPLTATITSPTCNFAISAGLPGTTCRT